jgi:hypothetical protein
VCNDYVISCSASACSLPPSPLSQARLQRDAMYQQWHQGYILHFCASTKDAMRRSFCAARNHLRALVTCKPAHTCNSELHGPRTPPSTTGTLLICILHTCSVCILTKCVRPPVTPLLAASSQQVVQLPARDLSHIATFSDAACQLKRLAAQHVQQATTMVAASPYPEQSHSHVPALQRSVALPADSCALYKYKTLPARSAHQLTHACQ